MLTSIMTSIALASAAPIADETSAPPIKGPTRYCRDMNNASSRLYAVKICKTRAEWRRWDACHGSVTRYCTPKRKAALGSLGRGTAYPLNDNARVICRWLSITGTRIRQQHTCLPKREWDRMFAETNEAVLKNIMTYSKLPRREGSPTPGR